MADHCIFVAFLFLAVAQLGNADGTTGATKIISTPKTTTAKDGDEVTLNCSISEFNGEDKVIWLKGGMDEVVSVNGVQLFFDSNIESSLDKTDTVSTYSLKIMSMSQAYADTYYCVTNHNQGDDEKVAFVVEMETPDSVGEVISTAPPKVSIATTTVTVEEDGRAELKCEIENLTPKNSIMWLKRPKVETVSSTLLSIGQTIYLSHGQKKLKAQLDSNKEITLSTLFINNVTAEDAGKYACSVQVLGMKFEEYPSAEVTLVVKKKQTPLPKRCYWKAYENAYLYDTNDFRKEIGPGTMLECMARCHRRTGCVAVTFFPKQFTCYILKASSGGDMSKLRDLDGGLYAELFC